MFKDWDKVPEWLKPLVEVAVERELIDGYPDGTIRVDAPLSRGEYIAGQVKLTNWLIEMIEELLENDVVALMKKIANSVVQVRSSAGLGAGVVLKGGKVLTNYHVVEEDAEVSVIWTSPYADKPLPRYYGPKYRVIKRDKGYDLALIDVSSVTTEGAELAQGWDDTDFTAVDERFVGHTLYTMGSPLGMMGIVSRGIFAGIEFYSDLYLTFMGSINAGNSGGGIFDTAGRLVTVVVAKPADCHADGIGFGVLPLKVSAFLKE